MFDVKGRSTKLWMSMLSIVLHDVSKSRFVEDGWLHDVLFQVERIIDQRQNMSPGVEILNIQIRRDVNGGLGLSIAGGLESTPYKVSGFGFFMLAAHCIVVNEKLCF